MKRILFSLIIFATLHIAGPSVTAQPVITPALQQALQNKGDDEYIAVNIRFAKQYDSQELLRSSRIMHSEQRRKYVIEELRKFSSNEQAAMLDFLNSRKSLEQVKDVKTFWMVNLIHCQAKPSVINELLNWEEIAQIDIAIERNVLSTESDDEGHTGEADKSANPSWNISLVNAPEAWQEGYTGRNVIVAILDTGVNYHHKDIEDNMWIHPDFPNYGYNTYNDNYSTIDVGGHGTHVAGTVAGTGAAGMKTGVAPDATIMIVKVLSSIGSGWEDRVWSGIEFAVEQGAHIMNLSLSWRVSWNPDYVVWRTLMDNAHAAGVISAVANGNSGSVNTPLLEVGVPGSIPPPWLNPDQTLVGGISSVIAVGSTNFDNTLSSFSSKGPCSWQDIEPYLDYPYNPGIGLIRPDVVAPGNGILSLDVENINGYILKNGTSMASPTAAGVMALMLSKNPYLSLEQIGMILEQTAFPLSAVKSYTFGSGLIDAHAAVLATPYLGVSSITIDDSQGNDDGKINPGELISLPFTLENSTADAFPQTYVKLSVTSPYIELIDSIAVAGDIQAGQTQYFEGVFSFMVSDTIPGNHTFDFVFEVVSNNQQKPSWTKHFTQTAFAPHLTIKNILIENSSSDPELESLEPGQSSTVTIEVENTGQLPSAGLKLSLAGTDAFFHIAANTFFKDPLEPGQSRQFIYELDVHPNAPVGIISGLDATLESGTYRKQRLFPVRIGLISEDWQSAGFDSFQWQFAGNADWYLTEDESVSGTYSARSGQVTHDSNSEIFLQYNVLTNDSISFYRKVSSENNRDWLEFYIDDQLMERWSGSLDWERVSFPVQSGLQTFRWVYSKDPTVSIGQDCAWIDMIQVPVELQSAVVAGFNSSHCGTDPVELNGYASYYDQAIWSTTGDGTFSDATSPQSLYFPGTQDYTLGQTTLKLEASLGETTISDSFTVSYLANPEVDLGEDVTICTSQQLVLDAGEGHSHILWSDGSTGQTLTVTSELFGMQANIWVVVTNQEGCQVTDDINVLFDPCVNIISVKPEGQTIKVYPNPAKDYLQLEFPEGIEFPATVSLFDNSGMRIIIEHYNDLVNPVRINLPALKSGMYYLRLDSRNLSGVTKVVIMN